MTDFEKAVEMIRMDAEKKNRANLNRIRSGLASYYDDLQNIKDEEMTVELGEAIRECFFQVFDILKENGINFGK